LKKQGGGAWQKKFFPQTRPKQKGKGSLYFQKIAAGVRGGNTDGRGWTRRQGENGGDS
jgi:hypothetical protein